MSGNSLYCCNFSVIQKIPVATSMPRPLRLLCHGLCDLYATPCDRYATGLRPLRHAFATAVPRVCDLYATPLRPLCHGFYRSSALFFLVINQHGWTGFRNVTASANHENSPKGSIFMDYLRMNTLSLRSILQDLIVPMAWSSFRDCFSFIRKSDNRPQLERLSTRRVSTFMGKISALLYKPCSHLESPVLS